MSEMRRPGAMWMKKFMERWESGGPLSDWYTEQELAAYLAAFCEHRLDELKRGGR